MPVPRHWMLVVPLLTIVATGCRTPLSPLPLEGNRSYQGLLEWSVQNGTPGAVLLVRSPRTNFLAAAGVADREQGIPVEVGDEFRIASLAKAFLGVVAAQLAAEGRLDLDACITNYLPDSVSAKLAGSNRITIRQLMRHTSGLYDFERSFSHVLRRYMTDRHGSWPPERDLKYAYGKRLDFEPGTGWRYSTTGYILLGMIIDLVAGRDHSLEIRDRILQPLGLHHTYCELTEPGAGTRVHGYENWFGWGWTDTTDWAPMTGGMVTSASDLAHFFRSAVRGDGVLGQGTRELMWAGRDKGQLGYDFGISLMRASDDSPWFFGHFGAAPGYISFAFHQPEHDITIVFLGNSSHISAPRLERRRSEFCDTLAKALFRVTLKDVGLANQIGAANGSQPIGPEPNRMPSTAGSRR